MKFNHCRSCGTVLEEVFSLGELYISNFIEADASSKDYPKSDITLLSCGHCGLLQLRESVDSDILYNDYWYRSGINDSMKFSLADVAYESSHSVKKKEKHIFLDIACFAAGSFINTENGYKDIKDIIVGDMVLSHNGTYNKVVKKFNRKYKGNFVKIKIKTLNINFMSTPEHPILTDRGWVQAKDIKIQDNISIDNMFVEKSSNTINLYNEAKKYHKHKVVDLNDKFTSKSNGIKHSFPKYIHNDVDLARLIGYYIGEGSGEGGAGLQFTFNINEMYKAKWIEKYFKETFGFESEIVIKKPKTLIIRVNSRILSSIFQGWCGHLAKNKNIPHFIVKEKTLPLFIKSLWFTDGHLTSKTSRHGKKSKVYVYNSVSKKLILDLHNILESVGIKTSVQHVKNNKGFSKKDGYIYRINVERKLSISRLEELFSGKIKHFINSKKYNEILQLEIVKKECEVYNLEVENTNTYVCDSVVVHNCNDGTLLNYVKNMKKVGIDPSNVAKVNNGILINKYFSADGYFEKIDSRAKIITCIAMFYDLDDPRNFLRDVRKVLRDDGIFVVQMSYTPLMLRQVAFDNMCAEHVCYYDLKSLEYILNASGFKVMDCTLNDVNGGSFRVFCIKDDVDESNFRSQPERDVARTRIRALRTLEAINKQNDSYKDLDRFIDQIKTLKIKVHTFIKEEVLNHKTVYAYGASTKGNSLLQYFGLDNTLITAAVERNPDKVGLKTIGTEIPIISEEQMREENPPDYLLILPWHFITEFETREAEFLKGGGKFIVPCPEFKIING